MSDRGYDAIVLGVGGMGSATLFELARRGFRVLGLEQFALGHDLGSSHGQTRIIRKAYYEHPDYVPLVCQAFESWYDLEQRSGKRLLTESPCLSIGLPDSEIVEGTRAAAKQHGLSIETLAAPDLGQRFPAFRFGDEYVGVLEHTAGILAVEECVLTHIEEAKKLGADVHAEEPVVSWEATDSAVSVRTAKGHYHAAKLVITSGPWAAQVLGRLGANLTVMRQTPLWFGTSQPELFRRDRFPVYIAETPLGLHYGFPLLDSADGVKVAQHYGAPELHSPAEIDRTIRAEDEAKTRQFLQRHLPAIDGPRLHESVCTYTLTPDRHFLIGVHPEHANVAIAAGFSGHGFKFATVIGEILADLAINGRTGLPISLFRLDRFAGPNADSPQRHKELKENR